MLGDKYKNICVVGDDDQALYRFRGATIQNILTFAKKFENCYTVYLTKNYRSDPDIIDFYNRWMQTTQSKDYSFDWGEFRHQKEIVPTKEKTHKSPAVVQLAGGEDWEEKIYNLLSDLKASGKISDYNQIAFLFNSVTKDYVLNLAEYLESNGINVYSPRSDQFFYRPEIKLALGLLMLFFPNYCDGLINRKYDAAFKGSNQDKIYDYFKDCYNTALEELKKEENNALKVRIGLISAKHNPLKSNTDYRFSHLLYELFGFKPFSDYLSVDLKSNYHDLRPCRNLAILTDLITSYEKLHNVSILSVKYYKQQTEDLFNLFLKTLFVEGYEEYQDDSEYAPSGSVSFLTIHQAKGLEFPLVIVASLGNRIVNRTDDKLSAAIKEIKDKYAQTRIAEPEDKIKLFDFWRLYYTAYSRAESLLILTQGKKNPNKHFREILKTVPTLEAPEFNPSDFSFNAVKPVNLKQSYSFTSHITRYETCPLQYKFFKELGFVAVREAGLIFGRLVHATIEDIHRAAIRKEEHLITKENIEKWFSANYTAISEAEKSYLDTKRQEAALDQVLRYAKRQQNQWERIKETEVDVSLVKENYILEGKIDLIKGEGNTVEIIDFKSEKKPQMEGEKLERYRRQLEVYAHLVEERTNYKVSKMQLYFTAEEGSVPEVSYNFQREAIDKTIQEFDAIVDAIQKKKFSGCSNNAKTCKECDFRHYCQKYKT